MTSTIEITHTAADGTLLHGDPRPHHHHLKANGWRWSRNLGAWYITGSRDTAPREHVITRTADALRSAGLEVSVSIDATRRPTADVEADRVTRSLARVEALTAKADRLTSDGTATVDRARQLADTIPLGQPILVDHYSARRDINYRAKISRTFDRGFETLAEGQDAARRAKAAERNQDRHLALGPTLRRIKTAEAEVRKIERRLTPCTVSGKSFPNMIDGPWTCSLCWTDVQVVDGIVASHGAVTDETVVGQLLAEIASHRDDIEFWQAHVDALAAAGEVVWGPTHFAKGDRVRTPHVGTVKRVNAKSLTVEWDLMPGITQTIPYNKITGKGDR